jgi:hypothetical protein
VQQRAQHDRGRIADHRHLLQLRLGPGGDAVVEVTQTPAGIAFSIRGAPAGPLPWVAGWTFRRNDSLLIFRRSGNSGPATELRIDTGGDPFILKRQ